MDCPCIFLVEIPRRSSLIIKHRVTTIPVQPNSRSGKFFNHLPCLVLILSNSYSFRIVRLTALRHLFQFSGARRFPDWRCSNHFLNLNMKCEEFDNNSFNAVHCHNTSHFAKTFRISNISTPFVCINDRYSLCT